MIGKTQKTRVAAALAAVLGAGVGTSQAAVQLAREGLGDAILLPYYTVRADDMSGAAWRTFIRLFNSSENAVGVKVRFREAENSRETLDFVAWLSPKDAFVVWTDPNADGQGNPGIRTTDVSCTNPTKEGDNWRLLDPDAEEGDAQFGVRYELFKDAAWSDPYADGGSAGIDRAREGHVEIIGVVQYAPGTQTADAVTHPQGGEPSCVGIENFNLGQTPSNEAFNTADDVDNVLAANSYLIRVETGQAVGVEATVLANFAKKWEDPVTGDIVNPATRMLTELVTDDQKPDLDSANPFSRTEYLPAVEVMPPTLEDFATDVGIFPDYWNQTLPDSSVPLGPPEVVEPCSSDEVPFRNLSRRLPYPEFEGLFRIPPEPGFVFPWVRGGVDAVSAVLTRSEVINEWARRSNPDAIVQEIATQWVLTFPTKHYYVDLQADETIPTFAPFNRDNIWPTLAPVPYSSGGICPPDAYWPFEESFQQNGGMSCNDFRASLYDYEENEKSFTSPSPTDIPGLCYETNVVTFGSSEDPTGADVGLTSTVGIEIEETNFPSSDATEGWAIFDLRQSPSAGGIPGGDARGLRGRWYVYYGLPVIGFQITNFQIGNGTVGNYAASNDHKYNRDIIREELN